ncbi:right-handed parallel beta-helix repeat-containing protein [Metapseudomonas furukawaii]|uniref:Right handed beta helix domain-containing protein n=1 Tax=Metapseudomonas furukawaii TaxID=1149133 RepID=A0AAD1C1X2_METFU|nr:right-handed parallel beta-helix repeat-containing protein [Pseudomonas furukawaii]ELS25802.1 hypothetical protein ppKF707_1332 [Pseudomonas furukawaii]BAU75949.1 hypothetical protein KF707C_42610 [Pseudomonas furukawaii]
MQGDFSILNFDPHQHESGVNPPSLGVLRNLSGVLHQQGRVTLDADLTEGELLDLAWQGQAGRDVIGAGVCAVPASEPEGFRVEAAAVVDGGVQVHLRPGRAWADGILTHLAGVTPDPQALVTRLATYLGPPLATPEPSTDQIDDGIRDAVILEVSEEALHGFQYPQRLIEPALGGPDTSERAYVNFRLRLLRLGAGEDCHSLLARLRDAPSAKGRLSATLAPVLNLVGDCPVVGGGGYTGFEHCLYRIEIAEAPDGAPARFKWSQWNGGLAGRGRFDASGDPDRVIIDAGRAAIVNSGLNEFYLEALEYDERVGAWTVVYGSIARLNTDHDLELQAPASFGSLPGTLDSVFFRLWNGIGEIQDYPEIADPRALRDGIRLAFDPTGHYRPGDYWTFSVRAGEIGNPQVLLDRAPPVGIVHHRVPLAEINWTGRRNTEISGSIEDCRRRFRPLTNQKLCCTFLVGDGVSSFGDFNALEEAAFHLPAAGGELCLLPGVHRTNLRLEGRRNVKIHGCRWRTLVLPRTETRSQPLLHFVDCAGIEVCDLDLVTFDSIAVRIDGSREDGCRDLDIHDNRMIARTNAIRATQAMGLKIAGNRLHLLDTVDGRATLSIAADDVLVERNTLVLLPFIDQTPDEPDEPDDDPTRDPADPCARPQILYLHPLLVRQYALAVWALPIAQLLPQQPYRALGGIHLRAGSERVRLVENTLAGGAGNGVTLGGDLDPAEAPPPAEPPALLSATGTAAPPATVNVAAGGQFLALVQDERGTPLSGVDLYLEDATVATDRSDAQGMASIKTAPGTYRLDVSPQFQVLRITEARDQGVLVNAVTLAARAPSELRGFLHEISIEANDISMMGLSGIGFAPRNGTDLKGPSRGIPGNDPKAALLAYLDAALLNLALTPLLRATDPVRDLVIRGNRLHHNLRNPFDDALLADAQFIGRGGVSLALVEAARISGNHIHENGPRAVDPVCGIFVGYGDNLEITDNQLAANGATTTGFEENRNAGIRGGLYLRFAGALTSHLSTSSGRHAALRVHDNRIDQPAGRALTAFAFGPVSVANNHFNSEFSGQFGFLDTMVGGVLILNLGGIHRLLARTYGAYLAFEPGGTGKGRFSDLAERALPGGETLFDDNYVRLGLANRSITSQVLLAADDLGYAANTSAVYRGAPFFANAVLMADTVRATASRLREDLARTLSLLTIGLRMNMTALNQADHCIVAQPAAGMGPLPTLDQPNQVLDAVQCGRLFPNRAAVGQFLVSVLAANAEPLGGTLSSDAFTAAELDTLGRQAGARALAQVNATQVATARVYQAEAARMTLKHGAGFPASVALNARSQADAETNRLLATSSETLTISTPTAPEGGSTFSGRLINDRGQGLADYRVALLRSNGTAVETLGVTDASGAFSAAYDSARTARLAKEGELFAQVSDLAGREVLRDSTALRFDTGAALQATLVMPVRVVPKSVVVDATLIYGTPAASAPTSPKPTPEPPPRVRTPLDRLELDDATRNQLAASGIRDVEGIVETSPKTLARILGGAEQAEKLTGMAKQALAQTPPPKPTAPGRAARTTAKKPTPRKR